MVKRVLITGGAGFVGSHIVEHILRNTNWDIVIMDRLDCSGSLLRLTDMECWDRNKKRVKFVFHDLKAELNMFIDKAIGQVDYVLHLAAGSHVDRSITDPMSFVMDNVVGTGNLLEWVRKRNQSEDTKITKFIYFSTDEVFGPAPEGVAYKEWDRFHPSNPYAATKAGAESLCDAYANTYKLPIITTHCMNIFGERQHPEKFIPMVIKKVMNGETVTIHSNKDKTMAGKRFYIHARNVAAAILFLIDNSTNGEKYNIVGEKEIDNLALAQMIADYVGMPLQYEMVDFHSSRPGHDLRYALDGTKLREMGFTFPSNVERSLQKTVEWTIKHKDKWL